MTTAPTNLEHSVPPGSSRPPTVLERVFDRGFREFTRGLAWLSVLLLIFFIYQIG